MLSYRTVWHPVLSGIAWPCLAAHLALSFSFSTVLSPDMPSPIASLQKILLQLCSWPMDELHKGVFSNTSHTPSSGIAHRVLNHSHYVPPRPEEWSFKRHNYTDCKFIWDLIHMGHVGHFLLWKNFKFAGKKLRNCSEDAQLFLFIRIFFVLKYFRTRYPDCALCPL